MQLGYVLQQLELHSEFRMQCIRTVTDDLESTAAGRAFWTKRRDNDVPARFHRARNLADVGRPVLRPGQKMKHRPIVPEIEAGRFERVPRDITTMPPDLARAHTQSLSGGL